MGLYDELLNNYDAKLIAGGAAQNTARGAQVCKSPPFPTPLPPLFSNQNPNSERSDPSHLPFFSLRKTVHPPPFIRPLHRLRRLRQIRRHPARSQLQSRSPRRIPPRSFHPNRSLRRRTHRP